MKIPSGIKRIENFHDGWAVVELDDGQMTFMDIEGELQEGRYQDAWDYSEGFAAVRLKNGFYAFVDKAGKLRKGRYKETWNYSEGFAAVRLQDGFYTFVDKEGNLQEGRYEDAKSYSEGFAAVKLKDGSWTFVDKEGKLQEGRYKETWDYSEGFALVRTDGGWTFLTKEGKLLEGIYLEVSNSYLIQQIERRYINSRYLVNEYGDLKFSLKTWIDVLEKDPMLFKYIPFHRFADEKFMAEVNAVIEQVLINYVKRAEDIESTTIYVQDVLKLINEKTEKAEIKINQFVAEIGKMHDKDKEEKEKLVGIIKNFFNERDEK